MTGACQVVKKDMRTTDCLNAKHSEIRLEMLEMSASSQQQAVTNARWRVGRRQTDTRRW